MDDGEDENVGLLRDTLKLQNIDVIKWIDLDEEEDVEISGIVSDARYAIPGDLFVCVITHPTNKIRMMDTKMLEMQSRCEVLWRSFPRGKMGLQKTPMERPWRW